MTAVPRYDHHPNLRPHDHQIPEDKLNRLLDEGDLRYLKDTDTRAAAQRMSAWDRAATKALESERHRRLFVGVILCLLRDSFSRDTLNRNRARTYFRTSSEDRNTVLTCAGIDPAGFTRRALPKLESDWAKNDSDRKFNPVGGFQFVGR